MADDVEENENTGESKKLLIIIIAVVVLLVGGIGAFFLLSGSSSEPMSEDMPMEDSVQVNDVSEGEDVVVQSGDAFYVGMPRPFVFNVSGYGRDRLVQIKVQLLVRGSDQDTIARKHVPLIEDTLLTVFSASNAEKLATYLGKQELRREALESIQQALEPIVGKPVVEQVLFIGFVMQ